jgi:hypothetical protein
MIVTGASRAAPHQLARQLLKPHDAGKRVEVLELPYLFNLLDILIDFQSLSVLTQGTKGLYHAQICPAPGNPMTTAQWLRAADILAEELGLQEHLRLVVLHDDGARPYLHVVWQRTDKRTDSEKWIMSDDSFNYRKHECASRRMEQEFGHPPVQKKRAKADPAPLPSEEPPSASDPSAPKFNRDEGRQARRTRVRITAMKNQVAALKAAAESPQAFKAALEDAGYMLARGDSGYILIDEHGSVYSLAGQLKMKLARVNEFMAPLRLEDLPTVDDAKNRQYQKRKEEECAGVNRRTHCEP